MYVNEPMVNILKYVFVCMLFLQHTNLFHHYAVQDEQNQIGDFDNAVAFSVDPNGNIYVLDIGKHTLCKYSEDGKLLHHIGGYGWGQSNFDQPSDVIAPNGIDVYVADYGNHRILRFDRNLNFISSFSTKDDEKAEHHFGYPKSVAISRSGELFISDGDNQRILKTSTSNEIERSFGGIGAGRGKLQAPGRIRISDNDMVYVQDINQIIVFDIFGNYFKSIGKGIFQELKTFTLDANVSFVLDSCNLYMLDDNGKLREKINLAEASKWVQQCDIVDVVARGESIFLLSHKNLKRYEYKKSLTK